MPGFDDALAAALKGEETQPEPVAAETPTPAETAPEAAEAQPEGSAQETSAQAAQRARDEAGRFAKKETSPEAQKQPVAVVKPAKGQQQAAPAEPAQGSAPRSWAPALREHWGKLPRDVRDVILKREGEATRAIGELGQARRFQQEFESVAAPYKALFTAPPVQVAANLFQTAAALQTGDLPTKAGIVAQMIRNFGIPPDAVADALEGKQAAPGAQPQGQPYRDPRVDDLLRRQQEAEQRGQREVLSVAQQALQEFEASAPEFLGDVREDMAILLQSGRAKTYEEAYRKACAMSDEVGRVLEERKAEAARTQSQQAQKARHAASSVKSEPAPPAGSRKPSFDDALAAALTGR